MKIEEMTSQWQIIVYEWQQEEEQTNHVRPKIGKATSFRYPNKVIIMLDMGRVTPEIYFFEIADDDWRRSIVIPLAQVSPQVS